MRTAARVNKLLVVAGVLALAGGVAYATIPDNGVIHGCYLTQTGQLRVIDTAAGDTCKPTETALDWNDQGPPGPKGDKGDQGDTGPQGPAGPGAQAFEATVPQGTVTLATPTDGVAINGGCAAPPGGNSTVGLQIIASVLDQSGILSRDGTLQPFDFNGNISSWSESATGDIDFRGLVRRAASSSYPYVAGKFAFVEVHGHYGPPCRFWGMVIPSG